MAVSIRPVATLNEYLAVCRLRYDVYVEERQLVEKYADHDRRLLAEPLDEQGTLLAAFDGDQVVGTVRSNLGDDPHIGPYADFYQMNRLSQTAPRRTGIVTKLMVDRAHRRSALGVRLVKEIYRLNLFRGVRYAFIDSNQNLLSLYERLGFVAHCEDAVHPVYGLVRRMMMDMQDEQHLRRVGSPMLTILQEWKAISHPGEPCATVSEAVLVAA